MNKNILIWGTAVLLVAAAIYVTNNNSFSNAATSISSAEASSAPVEQSEQAATTGEPAREQAIDFTLTDLDGNQVALSDLRGKNVYINFWTTWCKWCKKEMPDIEKIYQQYKDEDLIVLAVDVGEDKEKARQYIEDNDYSFRVLLDTDKQVTEAYQIRSIPVSLFIDKEGNIAHKKVGYMTEEEMKSAIHELIP
jgi:peroxiredoxin